MTLELHSVLFPSTQGQGYGRMAQVWEASAWQNSPDTPAFMHHITDADEDIKSIGAHRKAQFVNNVRKTRHHARIVAGATDGQILCLMDCDTFVLGDLSNATNSSFDIAITVRPRESQ
jgi:hypothetical protein